MILAMDDLGSLLLGWSVVLGSLAAYSAYLIRKGRSLARIVPDEDKPWT